MTPTVSLESLSLRDGQLKALKKAQEVGANMILVASRHLPQGADVCLPMGLTVTPVTKASDQGRALALLPIATLQAYVEGTL